MKDLDSKDKRKKLMYGLLIIIVIGAVLGILLLQMGTFSGSRTAGKVGDTHEETGTADAELKQLLTSAAEASANVRTLEFDFNARMTITTNTIQSMSMDGEGRVDLDARKMYMKIDSETTAGNQELEMYVIGDVTTFLQNDVWYKVTAPDSWNFEENMYNDLATLLDSGSARKVGNDVLDGEQVTVVRVTPDLDTLMGYLTNLQGETAVSGANLDLLKDSIEEVNLDMWIGNNNLIKMAKVDFTVDISTPSAGSASMNIGVTTNFKKYNEPVSIELPAEAVDAIDLDTIAV